MKRLFLLCSALTLSACSIGGNLTADVTESKIHDLETALADARLQASLAEEQAKNAEFAVQNIDQQPLRLDLLMTEIQQRSEKETEQLKGISDRIDAARLAVTEQVAGVDSSVESVAEQVAAVDSSVKSVYEELQRLSTRISATETLIVFSAEIAARSEFSALRQQAREKINTMFGIGGCAALPLTWNGSTRDVADFIAKARRLGLTASADQMDASMREMADELNRECRSDALKWQS